MDLDALKNLEWRSPVTQNETFARLSIKDATDEPSTLITYESGEYSFTLYTQTNQELPDMETLIIIGGNEAYALVESRADGVGYDGSVHPEDLTISKEVQDALRYLSTEMCSEITVVWRLDLVTLTVQHCMLPSTLFRNDEPDPELVLADVLEIVSTYLVKNP